jgi:hypothetical protein
MRTLSILIVILTACGPAEAPSSPEVLPDVPAPEVRSDAPSPEAPGYHVHANTMRTPAGDVLFLRGVNLSGRAKEAPGHLIDVDDALIAELLADGVNSVRFLTFWDAVMPGGPGEIDETYLAEMRTRVERLDAAGIFVIMDVHQDLWGHPFTGHGAPAWACPEHRTLGYEGRSPWWANYLSDQITGCFDHFWSSSQSQARYGQMLAAVAGAVCDLPRVVGFDIMNEPWPGSHLPDPGFDNDLLMPFYIDVMEDVEAVCPGKLHFFEPSGAFTFGLARAMEIPLELRDRVVVAPHFYPPYVHEPEGGGYGGDAQAHEALLLDLEDDWGAYLDMGVALWCGEYGGMTQSANFDLYFQHLHIFFLEHFVSSALWDHDSSDGGFAFLDAAGALKSVFTPVFRHPLPTLLPSKPTVFEADWQAGTLEVAFDCVEGGLFAVLLTGGCACDVPEGLSEADGPPSHASWKCDGDGDVTVVCSCT